MNRELVWALGLWALVVTAGITYAWRQRGRRVEQISRNLPVLSIGMLATLVVLALQASRIQIFQQRSYASRSGADPVTGQVTANSRLVVGDTREMRGSIVDANGRELAWSEDIDPLVQRRYGSPEIAHVAGFFSPLLYGKEGIELAADDALRHGIRRDIAEQLAGVFSVGSREPENVQLTIWSDLQVEAQRALAGRIGAAVVIDVASGAVRAMASFPWVDPGQLAAVRQDDVPATRAYWDTLLNDPGKPLLRRSTLGLYTPGSVFKVITAAAAIDSGIAEPGTVYVDDGALTVDGHTIVELNRPDDTIVEWTLTEGLAYSLNVVFAQVGLDLGSERLTHYARAFGFGEIPPFEYPVARSQVASSDDFLGQPAALADTAFGQGELQTTAIQMALVAQSIANGGAMVQPRLIDRYLAQDGSLRHRVQDSVWRHPVSATTAEAVEEMMVVAVESGYASAAYVPGLRIGGKTGTAEVSDGEPHAWFIGFGGRDRPECAVAVVLEHGGSGGSVASGVGGSLLASAIAMRAQQSAFIP